MATAVYVAEHSLVGGATESEVMVIVPNPWADFPPQRMKKLAVVIYDPDKQLAAADWFITGAEHAATLADIEYDLLGDKLQDGTVVGPAQREEKADNAARKIVIRKYGLPKDWVSAADRIGYLGITGTPHDREHIHIAVPDGTESSMANLHRCLTTNISGTPLLQGCMPTRREVAIDPDALGPPEPASGRPGNADCWGDDSRQDISCRNLTESFLLGMRNAPIAEVRRVMQVDGRPIKYGLHFVSNYSRGTRWGSGDVNFIFDEHGRVKIISASLDPPRSEGKFADFIWNRELLPAGCSDLPNSELNRCN